MLGTYISGLLGNYGKRDVWKFKFFRDCFAVSDSEFVVLSGFRNWSEKSKGPRQDYGCSRLVH